jgi:ATP phosphoribosyltransferase regulatory subunit
MRDLLPSEARRQSVLARRVLCAFELRGYERVSVPAFEYADVLERGLGALGPEEVLRFVEPETGEVVALRPDMTPQLARLFATRLAELPGPCRLCYEGSVLRRRRARARRHRQIPQAGIELIGSPAPDGDVEVLSVAAEAVHAAGLSDIVIDLGHARIAGSLIELSPAGARAELVDALALKDGAALERRAAPLGLPAPTAAALVALVDLYGGEEVWTRAEVLSGTPAESAALELRRIWERVSALGLARDVVVDLGETRNFAYYSGMMFQILAEGPGAPVASGGRYDALLAKFAAPRPAAGAALDLDNLAWALDAAGSRAASPLRVLVQGSTAEARDRALSALRAHDVSAAPAPPSDAFDYARAWRYSHVVELGSDAGAVLIVVSSGAREPVDGATPELAAEAVARRLQPLA